MMNIIEQNDNIIISDQESDMNLNPKLTKKDLKKIEKRKKKEEKKKRRKEKKILRNNMKKRKRY